MPPYSGDAFFIKLSFDGDVIWDRTWGGDGYEQARSVVPAGDSGYFIFGETDTYGAGNRDFFKSPKMALRNGLKHTAEQAESGHTGCSACRTGSY